MPLHKLRTGFQCLHSFHVRIIGQNIITHGKWHSYQQVQHEPEKCEQHVSHCPIHLFFHGISHITCKGKPRQWKGRHQIDQCQHKGCHDYMVRLVAEKVQKISERIRFSSGNIQINPVESCGKDADHQRKDKAEYFSSDNRIQGVSRKKCCGNVT